MPLRFARKAGDTVQFRDASGHTQNVIVGGSAGPAPATPTSTTNTTGGSLAATTTYGYKITAIVNYAETQASAQRTQLTGATATNTVTIDWAASPVPGASAYRIYGRTQGGPWGLLAEVAGSATSYTDTGAATPGASPASAPGTIGFKGMHDRVVRNAVPPATTMKSVNAYFARW